MITRTDALDDALDRLAGYDDDDQVRLPGAPRRVGARSRSARPWSG
jgi:hypothetical protein